MLITPKYAEEQQYLHEVDDPYLSYGDRSFNWGYLICGIAQVEGCRDVIDYGCGKGSLARLLAVNNLRVQAYDPGVRAYTARPQPASLLVTLDALEHVEPECLDEVLSDIRHLCLRRLFAVVSTRPAKRRLRDGRNAHLIVEDGSFWRSKFEECGFVMRREWQTGQAEWVALMNAPTR